MEDEVTVIAFKSASTEGLKERGVEYRHQLGNREELGIGDRLTIDSGNHRRPFTGVSKPKKLRSE